MRRTLGSYQQLSFMPPRRRKTSSRFSGTTRDGNTNPRGGEATARRPRGPLWPRLDPGRTVYPRPDRRAPSLCEPVRGAASHRAFGCVTPEPLQIVELSRLFLENMND